MKHFWIGFLCTLYVLSPVDLLPEAFLGPFGLPDDVVAGLIAFYKFRRALVEPASSWKANLERMLRNPKEIIMGLFNRVVRAVSGGPGHMPSYVQLVNHVARSLGLPVVWDDDESNCCSLGVHLDGRLYAFLMQLIGDTITLLVVSKIPMARIPGEVGTWLAQHSRELPWGSWRAGSRHFFVTSSMPAGDLCAETVRNAAGVAASELGGTTRLVFQCRRALG